MSKCQLLSSKKVNSSYIMTYSAIKFFIPSKQISELLIKTQIMTNGLRNILNWIYFQKGCRALSHIQYSNNFLLVGQMTEFKFEVLLYIFILQCFDRMSFGCWKENRCHRNSWTSSFIHQTKCSTALQTSVWTYSKTLSFKI